MPSSCRRSSSPARRRPPTEVSTYYPPPARRDGGPAPTASRHRMQPCGAPPSNRQSGNPLQGRSLRTGRRGAPGAPWVRPRVAPRRGLDNAAHGPARSLAGCIARRMQRGLLPRAPKSRRPRQEPGTGPRRPFPGRRSRGRFVRAPRHQTGDAGTGRRTQEWPDANERPAIPLIPKTGESERVSSRPAPRRRPGASPRSRSRPCRPRLPSRRRSRR